MRNFTLNHVLERAILYKQYYHLSKPGIIYGNALSAVGGFFLASKGHIDWPLFFAVLGGLSLIIGSACVFNNYIDRFIDAKMKRTQNRALVKKTIPVKNALIFGTMLVIFGSILLTFFTNLLTLTIALTGFVFYVFVYAVGKRKTQYGTLIGSISGAVPPVVGYCAVTNRFDTGAFLLFMILVFWQMPHFYAIAMNRVDDYKAAAIPVLPLISGMRTTKIHILVYIVGFGIMLSLLTLFGYTGYTYLIVMEVLTIIWFWKGIQGFASQNDKQWTKSMFLFSLVIILALSLMLAVGSLLP